MVSNIRGGQWREAGGEKERVQQRRWRGILGRGWEAGGWGEKGERGRDEGGKRRKEGRTTDGRMTYYDHFISVSQYLAVYETLDKQ